MEGKLAQNERSYDEAFHYLLGRLVHAYARFDFNIGLQFSFFNRHGLDTKKLLAPIQTTFGQRLRKLQPLIMKDYAFAGPAAKEQLAEWFKRANHLRAIRNDFVHGRWAIPGVTKPLKGPNGQEPTLELIPLDWNMDAGSQAKSVQMTLSQFESQVKEAESVFTELFSLLKKYDELAGVVGLTATLSPPLYPDSFLA